MRLRHTALALVVLSLLLATIGAGAPAASAAGAGDLHTSSFLAGDFLVIWRSGEGATIAYRGVPLFTANPSEFIVHRAWEDVYYRSNESEQRGRLTDAAPGKVLTVRDRSEHFRFQKRILVRPDGTLRLEYEYELLDPAEAELQVLFGVGRPWLHQSQYRLVAGGRKKQGELSVPETGRTDPWSNATEQTFVTEYGTLSISSDRGLNLLCRPGGGALWWAQALSRGETYRTVIDVRIQPGPAAETGLVLTGLEWSRRVRSGRASFRVGIARKPDGPWRIALQARPAEGGGRAGRVIEAALTDAPRTVQCSAPVAGRGRRTYQVVISDAESGEELLRLAPLDVESDPYIRAMPRLSLYTHEQRGEIIVRLADDLESEELSVIVDLPGVAAVRQPVSAHQMRLPVDLTGLGDGVTPVRCQLLRGDAVLGVA
ncbi:MAG: hypothetical protein U9R79_11485, partial [Armatimonadota bacterium]|nr:hypothetical protein [Armatimonadota bacterium]